MLEIHIRKVSEILRRENLESPKPYIFTDGNPNTMDDYARSIKRLKRPTGRVDVVLDTDMYNEVDDQFALAYLLQNTDRLNLKDLCSPFIIITRKALPMEWKKLP